MLPAKVEREVPRSEAWVALVRGRIEHMGPTTARRIGELLGLEENFVSSSLEALEGQGTVMRGSFTEQAQNAATNGSVPEVEWCDRRLLARIHRLTMQGLRQQIQPVEPRAFLKFLTRYHHVVRDSQWGGAVGVREAIAQLQGFELPAGAWEKRVLAARVSEYDPQWLDNLFLSGEVVWGRLDRPQRDPDDKPSMAALTRVVPISLVLREELPQLLPPEPATAAPVRGGAQTVLTALAERGALFFNELKTVTQLLPGHLEEALRELAALGLITSDAFAAVRKIVEGERTANSRRRRSPRTLHGVAAPIGRWSLFPGPVPAPSREAYLDAWCRQLLRRYGVIFRDLLERESSAPTWQELVGTLRRLELRGEVRGGRFVSQVAGEQYALPTAIDLVRETRGGDDDEPWIVLSAADPLNLFGIITAGARVAATNRNAIVVQAGRLMAAQQAGHVEFYEPVDLTVQWEMRRAMAVGRRREPTAEDPHLPAERYHGRR